MGPRSRAGEMGPRAHAAQRRVPAALGRAAGLAAFRRPQGADASGVAAIEVDCQALFTEDESKALLVLTAAPRSEAESRLKLMAVLGAQQFVDEH